MTEMIVTAFIALTALCLGMAVGAIVQHRKGLKVFRALIVKVMQTEVELSIMKAMREAESGPQPPGRPPQKPH